MPLEEYRARRDFDKTREPSGEGNANGTADNRTFYVYGYSFALTAGKTVKSVTLPTNAKINVLGVTLAPPVPASAAPQPVQPQVDLSTAFNNVGVATDGYLFANNAGPLHRACAK